MKYDRSCHIGFDESIQSMDDNKSRIIMDPRVQYELEPLCLPSKLQDRILKAQRRAIAEKDGVSIFTTVNNSSHRTSSYISQQHSRKEKLHLPDVVLGHKMREFEAKMNMNGLSMDPLENKLNRLSIEEKEKVILKMHDKIQTITTQVDTRFEQIKTELDANGIFDSTANYQRAQAMCLVELQKRCKLETIRDDAMRDVLREEDELKPTSLNDMEGKLNTLLTSSNWINQEPKDKRDEDKERSMLSHWDKGVLRPRKRLSPLAKKKKIYLSPQPSLSIISNQQDATENVDRSRTVSRESTRQSSIAGGDVGTQGNVKDDDDIMSHHPHITSVIHQLEANGGVFAVAPDEDELEGGDGGGWSSTGAGSVEDWSDRSYSYQMIAARICLALRVRQERRRWDLTHHFYYTEAQHKTALPESLLLRLHRHTGSTPREDPKEQEEPHEINAEKTKKLKDEYQQMQAGIEQRRLVAVLEGNKNNRIQRASTAGSYLQQSNKRRPSASSFSGTIEGRASTAGTVNSSSHLGNNLFNIRTPRRLPRTISRHHSVKSLDRTISSLKISSSTTVLDTKVNSSDTGQRRRSAIDAAAQERRSSLYMILKKKRGTQRESLIGAPVDTNMNTLGHFSKERGIVRRNAAQTWAWHHTTTPLQDTATNDGDDQDGEDVKECSDKDTVDNEQNPCIGNELNMGSNNKNNLASSDSDVTLNASSSLKQSHKRRERGKRQSISYGMSSVGSPTGKRLVKQNSTMQHNMNALLLQHRIEELWRILEFPYSSKLAFMEKYAEVPDGDALERALVHWEDAAMIVVLREKMKSVITEYEATEDLKDTSYLTTTEWDVLADHEISFPDDIDTITAQDLVAWIQENMDTVSQLCEAVSKHLKTKTGDDLIFQGHKYLIN